MPDQQAFPPQQQEPPGSTRAMQPVPDHGEQSYVGAGRLVGRRALVTGGDSGIGRAVAIAFAREGADVAIGYLPEEQADAEETADWVRQAGRRVALLPGDLTDELSARELPQRAVDLLGALDILVNNAGFQTARGGGIDDLDPERLERVVRTNLLALLWVTQAALPHLPRGGAIINTSSIQAYEPSAPSIDDASTKAAINDITVNLAAELGPRGIRVNAVAPGPICTQPQPATQDPDHLAAFGGNTPLGRAGQPAEVAPAFVFLASQRDASYVSGSVLGVTGGRPVF
ncbi:MAG: SDR family oxidoreductase [Cellulomonas sp.]|uniref:SDR family oxidoreductase n=1 Tax=Cellulomonas sp. 73-92 TaxID=1895740 RepID=UPI000929B790|nr:SDR family oxidoreductase [Cellulomonas sp. 73-92]MBN9375781.1 SDR family oxidoreductase [Cellulomonas sp.]OJV82421.1 MAG: NAD(P)-dependent oxidoreductase [Cellulomonas sp. 73-92]